MILVLFVIVKAMWIVIWTPTKTYSVISYDSGWMKGVVNKCFKSGVAADQDFDHKTADEGSTCTIIWGFPLFTF